MFGPTFELRPTREHTSRGSTCGASSAPRARAPGSAATSATARARSSAFPAAAWPAGSTARWRRSRTSRSRRRRTAGRRSCCSATTATGSSGRGGGGAGLGRADARRSGSRCRSGGTTSARVRATDPWSLLRNSDRWRRNPLSDDGHYFTTGLQLDLDTRNDRDDARPPAGCSGAASSTRPATTWRRSRCPRPCGPPITDGGRLRLRPADARSPALLAPHARRSGSTAACAPTAGSAATRCRSSAAFRWAVRTCCPGTRSATSPARRPGSPIPRTRRCATGRSPPRSRSAPASASTWATGCADADERRPRALHRSSRRPTSSS